MALTGTWYNELGSTMTLQLGADGKITGTYQSAVAEGVVPPARPLVGVADASPAAASSRALAFVVEWGHPANEAGSVTAWSGQFRTLATGDEVIVTTWLLTTELSEKQAWASTQVGSDTFTRFAPTKDQAARARSLRALRPLPTRPA